MVSSTAKTVDDYLAELSPEAREVISQVRNVVLQHLPEGYEEVVNWGMITYEVPLSVFPNTYNKKPLMYAALAAQKNHYALYLTAIYQDESKLQKLKDDFAAANKKLDMGKSCVRFRKLENLPLEVIGEWIGSVPLETFLAQYERIRGSGRNKS
jgi:uncharacterized protein YdhG (YjbR/CyaY superfamily)